MRRAQKGTKKRILLLSLVLGMGLLSACGSKDKQTSAGSESDWDEMESFETFETDDFDIRSSESLSGKLEKTLAYIESTDMERYTEESWNQFVNVYANVYTEYLDGADDARCDELQMELEIARCKLEFKPAEDISKPLAFRELSADEMVADMGTGWNLGNTMEGHNGYVPGETVWQDTITTKALIKAVHDMGFHTVRIPVTWGSMIMDEYTIDDKWISRVQDIVDYCIEEDMYVIINIHHDGDGKDGWLNIGSDDIDSVYEEFEDVWRCIANRFKDYDEHLIFESMNEISGSGNGFDTDTQMIMNLNQIFVNVVRSTGANNTKRWLSVPGRMADIEQTTNEQYGFSLPKDFLKDRLFVSVHCYDQRFGKEDTTVVTEFDMDRVMFLSRMCDRLSDSFTGKGIPVILSEYGAVNKNNGQDRAYYNEVVNYLCKKAGIVPVCWDQGSYDRTMEKPDFSYALIDRKTFENIEPVVTDGLLRGYFLDDQVASVEEIGTKEEIKEISEIQIEEPGFFIPVGTRAKLGYTKIPSDADEVILWASEDSSVATVYQGEVIARGIGTTLIHAYSQSNKVTQTIEVTVLPQETEARITGIYLLDSKLSLSQGKYTWLNATFEGGDESTFLTYRSMDPNIAFVSRLGKVTAVANGETQIVITASDGYEISVPVIVEGYEEETSEKILRLALNVLYNDETLEYYGNEVGSMIEITGDGEYTVTFDCENDLGKDAVSAGVTGLSNLMAIYIKDADVTEGDKITSGLISCDIQYDAVVVDGVELTLTENGKKTALKASGIFDTNDPINAWDGSAVLEVTEKDHVLNFTSSALDNPQTISITFTISNLIFEE